MSTVKVGSLFDGIGGTPLSAVMCGAEPVWASEIEKWPISITKRHFPNMKHLGDITQINGAEIEPVDIIVGGSPCQDLSVAGKREGLGGERSGLFMDQCRIVKEMRNAGELRNQGGRNNESIKRSLSYDQECDDSRRESGLRGNSRRAAEQAGNGSAKLPRPRYMVWENVPGAFSSNKGEDFRAVLEEIARIADPEASIPRPPKGKWLRSGTIMGDGYSISWRTVDAQYWGVPQRRRRIYLVADFGGSSATEICFEREGVSGDITEGGEARKGVATDAERGVGEASVVGVDCYNHAITGDISATLTAESGSSATHSGPQVMTCLKTYLQGEASELVLNDQGVNAKYDMSIQPNTSQTLVARGPRAVAEPPQYIVRRLTPLECERLQGYPDGWTQFDEDGKEISDTQRYKALGNSFAVPNAYFFISRCVQVLNGQDPNGERRKHE